LNRRHLTEGQKAVLANEYMKVLSKKAKTQRAEIANAMKYGKVSLSDTATDKESERHEVDTRKEASDKFKVSLNRRHLTEGQKAVLANEYRKILSKKRQSEAGKKAINARWHPDSEYSSETVSEQHENEVDTRKEASDKFKVSLNRRHLTEGQKAVLANEYMKILSKKRQSEAGKKAINARWHPEREYDSETVSESYEEQESSRAENGSFLPQLENVSQYDKNILLYVN